MGLDTSFTLFYYVKSSSGSFNKVTTANIAIGSTITQFSTALGKLPHFFITGST